MSHSRNEHARALANYLPGGKLFSTKLDQESNLYKFLFGLAQELKTASDYTEDYRTDILPDQTIHFIDEWESAVGIPDDCFPGDGDLNTRRTHVLVKLASLGVQTGQDFVDLAALFGITVTVTPNIDLKSIFPLTFPIVFDSTVTSADRFTIIVEYSGVVVPVFPLTFPIFFGTVELGILECLFNKLKPANCRIIFREA